MVLSQNHQHTNVNLFLLTLCPNFLNATIFSADAATFFTFHLENLSLKLSIMVEALAVGCNNMTPRTLKTTHIKKMRKINCIFVVVLLETIKNSFQS